MAFKNNGFLKKIAIAAPFIYYFLVSLYKLTDAPIWQDESMEFYCSVTAKDPIRGITPYETMYERMAYIQQQPPLYNWLMALWLRINEGEWWYRFSSVLGGFIAAMVLYKLIKKWCGNYAATLSVFVFSSIYIVQYYIKEASEYIFLILFVFCTIYYFLEIMEKADKKNILLFTLFCIFDMLTHYGAVFVVVPLGITVLIYLARKREWKLFKLSLISDVSAAVGVGAPLLIFFVLPQSQNAVSTLRVDKPIEITCNNIIVDFFDAMMWVLRWCMLDYDRDAEKITWAIWIVLFALIIIGIFVYRKTKRSEIRYYMAANLGVFLLYYVITTLNIYSYGWFGNRYNLFILPLWFVQIAFMLYEALVILRESEKKWMPKAVKILGAGIVAAMFLFILYGDKRVHNHWAKMDLRTVVNTWYADDGNEVPTFVNFHQRYPFVYYFTHNDRYSEADWDNVYCNLNLDSLSYSDELWIEYLKRDVYTGEIPQRLYVVSGQRDTVVNALESIGYTVTPVVDTTAKLFLLESGN